MEAQARGGLRIPIPIRMRLLVVMLVLMAARPAMAQLAVGYYDTLCPAAEIIVQEEVSKGVSGSPGTAAGLLRLHFHDCFVKGCDASILLDSTASLASEKRSVPNKDSARGFEVVDEIKAALEAACPRTVSCADVLALMARDAVFLTSGPSYAVPLGRRDGLRSVANDTKQLPPPTSNFTRLAAMFAAKGLSPKDIVVLSGAHTLGTARCVSFSDRLYNYTGANNLADVDPELDGEYVTALRSRCQSLADNTTLAEMDAGSFETFDAGYYRLVAKRRGVLHSDAALLEDEETRAYVERQATGMFVAEFFRDFAESMVKMGSIGVLTGDQGEIRNKCYVVNSHH